MDYSNLRSRLFYGLLIVAAIYIIFCITEAEDPSLEHNKEFAQELALKLETVKDLDVDEKRQIHEQMTKILNKKAGRMHNIAKQSFTSALRGGLTGGLVGGVEGALAGSVAFGVMSPVIVLVESML